MESLHLGKLVPIQIQINKYQYFITTSRFLFKGTGGFTGNHRHDRFFLK